MPLTIVNPPSLPPPRGYSHGIKGTGEVLFVAGQIGCDAEGQLVGSDFVTQFARALDNVLEVVRAAGGSPEQVARLILFVTDRREYEARRREIGEAYRERMGRHFPAMALLEVRGLLEYDAKVELEAIAIL